MDIKVKARDVVGPMPFDNSALIALWAQDKTFLVSCPLADGEICHDFLASGQKWKNPYDFLVDLLRVRDATVTSARLFRSEDALYSSVFVEVKGDPTPLKISSDNPAMAVNAALYSKTQLFIDQENFEDLVDHSAAYEAIRKSIPKLWPLSPLTDTDSLAAFDDFIDRVASEDGSLFRAKSKRG